MNLAQGGGDEGKRDDSRGGTDPTEGAAMSKSTAADVFFGFPISQRERRIAERAPELTVQVSIAGEDGNITPVLCARGSLNSVEVGAVVRLGALTVGPTVRWERDLRDFCEKYDISWPTDGPAWYVAPLRL